MPIRLNPNLVLLRLARADSSSIMTIRLNPILLVARSWREVWRRRVRIEVSVLKEISYNQQLPLNPRVLLRVVCATRLGKEAAETASMRFRYCLCKGVR